MSQEEPTITSNTTSNDGVTLSYFLKMLALTAFLFVVGYLLISGVSVPFTGPKIDLYQAVVNRMGMQSTDPKLESLRNLGTCKIEGRNAAFGLVQFSYNMLSMGGTNKRQMATPMYVIARVLANGNIENFVASSDQAEQVESLKSKWHDFWGCK